MCEEENKTLSIEEQKLLFEQYKLYTEQKDKYTDRTFLINRFYVVMLTLLIVLVFAYKDVLIGRLSIILVLSVLGMLLCTLWWINIDTYNILIKMKLSKVVEELEKKLPAQPFQMEFNAMKKFRENKKEFIFSDIQKVIAIFVFLVFFVLFLAGCVPIFLF